MTELVTVPFHGDTLFCAREERRIGVAIKPISDRLGLSWSGQYERLNRDPILAEGIRVTRMPSVGGEQETVTLDLPLLPGWLFGVSVKRVRAECREAVLLYQRRCHDVLHRHFFGGEEGRAVVATAPHPAHEEPMRVRRQLVTEARQTFGVRAAGSLWFALGLPVVPEMHEPPRQGDFGFTYTARPLP